MNRSRVFRLVLGMAMLFVAAIAFVQGDLVTALLALLGAALCGVFAVGMKDADQKAGLDWRTAEPWGRGKADATLVVILVLASVPVVLQVIG